MDDVRMKAMLDSADMVALLQAGLESKDDDIDRRAIITTSDLCRNNEVASDLLDNHPDLVKALVKTFSISGVCIKFYGTSQPPPLCLSVFFLLISLFF